MRSEFQVQANLTHVDISLAGVRIGFAWFFFLRIRYWFCLSWSVLWFGWRLWSSELRSSVLSYSCSCRVAPRGHVCCTLASLKRGQNCRTCVHWGLSSCLAWAVVCARTNKMFSEDCRPVWHGQSYVPELTKCSLRTVVLSSMGSLHYVPELTKCSLRTVVLSSMGSLHYVPELRNVLWGLWSCVAWAVVSMCHPYSCFLKMIIIIITLI